METLKAIFSRRTIHEFESIKVNEDIIIKAIEAANQAPCHKLTFPWRFYSIGLDKRSKILGLALELKSQKNLLTEKSKAIIEKKYLNPSHLLISTQILSDDNFTRKEDYAACSCAIQNLAIALASFGVSIKWSTGPIIRDHKIYEITDIAQKKEEIIGFIWVGYGKNPKEIHRPLTKEIYRQI